MSEREDHRLVELLYDELSAEEKRAYESELSDSERAELDEMDEALSLFRSVEDEEPSPHLDSLLLARARESVESEEPSWIGKLLARPGLGLAFAGLCTVVIAVVAVPVMQKAEDQKQYELEAPATTAVGQEQEKGFGAAPGQAREPAKAEAPAEAPDALEEELAQQPEPTVPRQQPARRSRRKASRATGRSSASRGAVPKSAPAPAKEQREEDGIGLLGDLGGGGAGSGASAGKKKRSTKNDSAGLAMKPSAPPPPPAPAEKTTEAKAPATRSPAPSAAPMAESEPSMDRDRAERSVAADDEAYTEGESGSALESQVRDAIRRADQAKAQNKIKEAREILIKARIQVLREKNLYAELSLHLAQLEYGAKRYAAAETYARDALRTTRPDIKSRATALIRAAQAAQAGQP